MPDVEVRFGYPMRKWQRECAGKAAGRRFVVLALHRRAGKTEIALKKLLNAAMRATVELPMFFYVAPFRSQAKVIAWARLKQMVAVMASIGQVEVNESDLFVRFAHNGAEVRLFGADNPDAMRGVRLDGAIVDEVAQIKPEVWEEILQPALSDRKGWAWFIGTPKGVNLFSELYFGATDRADWASARYTVYETDALDPAEVERLRQTMSEASFAREYLCDFSAAGDNQVMSLTDVEEASRRVHPLGSNEYAPLIAGVDPARFGDDRSVLFPRRGLVAMKPLVWRGVDNMTLAGHVADWMRANSPDAVFCDAGAGSGVIDRLRQLSMDVVEVNFAGRPSDPVYLNKRAEMWFNLRDWLRNGGALPNDTALKQDLAGPTYEYDRANRIQLEAKEAIKKRGLPSPDLADALALTFAHPVGKRSIASAGGAPERQRAREHDPYS